MTDLTLSLRFRRRAGLAPLVLGLLRRMRARHRARRETSRLRRLTRDPHLARDMGLPPDGTGDRNEAAIRALGRLQ